MNIVSLDVGMQNLCHLPLILKFALIKRYCVLFLLSSCLFSFFSFIVCHRSKSMTIIYLVTYVSKGQKKIKY